MTSPNCALCDAPITEDNDTKEHIIPNSIGGRRTIRRFICRTCNSKSGDKWDSELAEQLIPLSLFFGISRQRGDVPARVFETTSGEKLLLSVDGSMGIEKASCTETPLDTKAGVQIQLRARDKAEAKKMLKGVKRKYPQIDMDEAVQNLETSSSYCAERLKLNIQFGGPEAGRSIVKSALALAAKSGIPARVCKEATSYLRNEDSDPCFGYFYQKDLVTNRPEGVPVHCVSVRGCSKTRRVTGYVEYFGVQRVVLCLSKSYEGEDISATYAINPVTGKEIDLIVELSLSTDEIKQAYDYKMMQDGSVADAFDKVFPPRIAEKANIEKDRVLQNAVKYAFENCGAKEGEVLEPEHVDKLVSLVMEKLNPFLLHQLAVSQTKYK